MNGHLAGDGWVMITRRHGAGSVAVLGSTHYVHYVAVLGSGSGWNEPLHGACDAVHVGPQASWEPVEALLLEFSLHIEDIRNPLGIRALSTSEAPMRQGHTAMRHGHATRPCD